jgi:hypothetical protein
LDKDLPDIMSSDVFLHPASLPAEQSKRGGGRNICLALQPPGLRNRIGEPHEKDGIPQVGSPTSFGQDTCGNCRIEVRLEGMCTSPKLPEYTKSYRIAESISEASVWMDGDVFGHTPLPGSVP